MGFRFWSDRASTDVFNFGPTLDKVLANTEVILQNQETILADLAALKADVAKIETDVTMIYSGLFQTPYYIGLDLRNVVTKPQAKPTKPGP